jgi:hypothetical protein
MQKNAPTDDTRRASQVNMPKVLDIFNSLIDEIISSNVE